MKQTRSTDPIVAPRRDRRAVALTVILLAVGVAGWLWLHASARNPVWATSLVPLAAAAGAAALLLIPAVRRHISAGLDLYRRPGPKSRALTAIGVALTAGVYLAVTAFIRGRELFPRMHDELSYQLGAQMLAHGRLWMPAHPLADFFETFHVLVRPVYASIYFPGTAIMHVPGVWLGLPMWITAVALAGAVVGMTYRVVAEMLDDGVAGLLASLIVVATKSFRQNSTLSLAEAPAALLGLAMIWAWLQWRRSRSVKWAAAIGAAAGWAAITRPVDALAFAVPVGAAMAWELRPPSPKRWALTGGALLAAAAPFLLLQLAFNRGVTGQVLTPPYLLYLQENQPGSAFGADRGRPDKSAARPASALPQKQIYYKQFISEQVAPTSTNKVRLFIDRAVRTAWIAVPTMALLILVPVALPRLARGPGWVLCVVPPLFLALYTFNPHFLGHYVLPLIPAIACWVVTGAAAVSELGRSRGFAATAAAGPNAWLTVVIAAACVAQLPEVNPRVNDEAYRTPLLSKVEQELAKVETPAVVLFRFTPGGNVHEEPVYNSGVAWPDDAPVIRAHDLGPRNAEIFAYYGSREPRRMFYLFDRADGTLVRLGPVDEAAARIAEYDPMAGAMQLGGAADAVERR